jgi:DNA-binding FadR family transcriptional regulator
LDDPIVADRLRDDILSQIVGLAVRSGLGPELTIAPDRELAKALGTSRVTVREALGVLQSRGFLEPRRGSGTRLRAPRSWSLAMLPAVLEGTVPGSLEAASLRPLVIEALALRRSFARTLPGQLAGRLATGSLAEARRRSELAFGERASPARFVARDAEALRAAPESAGATAAAWLWNDLSRPAEALARWPRAEAPVPADYLARQGALWDALEAGDAARAERLIGAHLARLDRGLLAAFEAGAEPESR